MDIKLQNCNNIENGEISILKDSLNIKYAINGTGKTTIAKAIKAYIDDKDDPKENSLMNLKPFKYKKDENHNNPDIEGVESIGKVAIFNEEYISQFVFLPDELLKNSLDVFIIDETYEQGMERINEKIKVIEKTFREDDALDKLLADLNELYKCFGTSKKISKASSIAKGIEIGDKVENIPEELDVYKEFIQHPENTKWLKWQMDGNRYIENSEICPYCTSDIEERKETILAVEKEYNPKLVEHLNKVIGVVEELAEYFTKDTYDKIIKISKSIDGFKEEHEKYLLEVREQINVLIGKLDKIKHMNYHALKNFGEVKKTIEDYMIDMDYLSHLNSKETREKIKTINSSLNDILEESGKLQGEINKQNSHISKTIKSYNKEINVFLKKAGYNYHVNIEEDENQTYKLKLKHNENAEEAIEDVKLHLSFGERNAFALVLFMFEAIKNNPDLIILDDPISSFDKNKKYAIIDMLFVGKNSLDNKTVLMLTHDFEPIVDMIRHHTDRFKAKAHFLENIDGELKEKAIQKNDIKTYFDITKDNIANLERDINKLIYLRRSMEIQNDKSEGYQLLSNLFHKRKKPIKLQGSNKLEMSEEEIERGSEVIASRINNDFNYGEYYSMVSDVSFLIKSYNMASNNYEKLQLYRMIFINNSENAVIRKFVNETYHIETDYLYQLNPVEYEIVPQYVIDECDKDIEGIKLTEFAT